MENSEKNSSSPAPSLRPSSADAQFLQELWRDDQYVHFLAVRGHTSGQFQSHSSKDLKSLAESIPRFVRDGNDVYHACACFANADDGRKAQNAVGAYAFWVDIDCGPTKVEYKKGYADEDEATKELEAFCAAHGLPRPNGLVHSGGGVHAYWFLDDFVEKEQWREHAVKLKALANKGGFLADPSRTSDIASLLRVPGTLNHKYDPPRKVVLAEPIGARIANADMLQAIDAAWHKHCTPVEATAKQHATATPRSNGLGREEEDYGPLDLQKVASALKVLDPDCDEGTWKLHRLAPLAREALKHPEHAEALQTLARDWSSGALSGTPSKQWRTPGRSSGKTGEQAFDGQWRRFIESDRSEDVITLGTLFFHAKQQGWSYGHSAGFQVLATATEVTQPTTKKPTTSDGPAKPYKEIEPWAEPVDPAALFSEAAQTILRYVVMETEQADAVVLWVAHTHLIDVLDISPLCVIDAPERACAKTLLQTVISWMTYRSLSAANASLSAVFRAVEHWGCTLFIDEADTFFKDNKELQGVVNAGYKRGGVVLRAEAAGDNYEPRAFSVYGAKSIAGIALSKHLTDATMSRGIVINMRRKMATEKVDRIRGAQKQYFEPLASKFARFAEDYADRVQSGHPQLPEELSDRAQDNWEPLLAIAKCAGPEWFERGCQAARKLSALSEARGSASNDLLSDIREVLGNWPNHTIKSVDLIRKLCADPEMGWDTYHRGKAISARQLAKYLSAYGLAPRTVRQKNDKTPKGYYIDEFKAVFARYLKPLDDRDDSTTTTPDVAATAQRPAPPLLPPSASDSGGVADTSGDTSPETPPSEPDIDSADF